MGERKEYGNLGSYFGYRYRACVAMLDNKINDLSGWSVEQRRTFAAGAVQTMRQHYSWARVARNTIAVCQRDYETHE